MTFISERYAVPYTAESLLIGTSCSVALTTANYAPTTGIFRGQLAEQAFISVETANVRYKLNNSSPATACGHLFVAGDYMVLDHIEQLQHATFLNEAGTATAYVHVTYFAG